MSEHVIERFNIYEAKTRFSRIIERVEQGEEIIISRSGKPVAKVVPLTERVQRNGRGSLKGMLTLTDDWDSPETNASVGFDFGLGR